MIRTGKIELWAVHKFRHEIRLRKNEKPNENSDSPIAIIHGRFHYVWANWVLRKRDWGSE